MDREFRSSCLRDRNDPLDICILCERLDQLDISCSCLLCRHSLQDTQNIQTSLCSIVLQDMSYTSLYLHRYRKSVSISNQMDKIYHQRMAVDLHYPLHSRSLLDSQTATFPAKGRKNQDPQ